MLLIASLQTSFFIILSLLTIIIHPCFVWNPFVCRWEILCPILTSTLPPIITTTSTIHTSTTTISKITTTESVEIDTTFFTPPIQTSTRIPINTTAICDIITSVVTSGSYVPRGDDVQRQYFYHNYNNKLKPILCRRGKRFIRRGRCCCRRIVKPKCRCCRRACQVRPQIYANSCGGNVYQPYQQFTTQSYYQPFQQFTTQSYYQPYQQTTTQSSYQPYQQITTPYPYHVEETFTEKSLPSESKQLPELIKTPNLSFASEIFDKTEVQPSTYNKKYFYQTLSNDNIISSYFDKILNKYKKEIVPIKTTSPQYINPFNNYQSVINVSEKISEMEKQF
uniref:Uncharacterized protein n=1 Tax=Strongyloides stercoralis TaxID=6248 RepID=A0A0K0EFA4_STRER